jgi:hypothetical protein
MLHLSPAEGCDNDFANRWLTPEVFGMRESQDLLALNPTSQHFAYRQSWLIIDRPFYLIRDATGIKSLRSQSHFKDFWP